MNGMAFSGMDAEAVVIAATMTPRSKETFFITFEIYASKLIKFLIGKSLIIKNIMERDLVGDGAGHCRVGNGFLVLVCVLLT